MKYKFHGYDDETSDSSSNDGKMRPLDLIDLSIGHYYKWRGESKRMKDGSYISSRRRMDRLSSSGRRGYSSSSSRMDDSYRSPGKIRYRSLSSSKWKDDESDASEDNRNGVYYRKSKILSLKKLNKIYGDSNSDSSGDNYAMYDKLGNRISIDDLRYRLYNTKRGSTGGNSDVLTNYKMSKLSMEATNLHEEIEEIFKKLDITDEQSTDYISNTGGDTIRAPTKSNRSTLGLADSSPPGVHPAVSSFNYLSLKSKATPRDRGECEVVGDSGDKKHYNPPNYMDNKPHALPYNSLNSMTSSGLPVADLKEAEGEVNREGHHGEWKTSGGDCRTNLRWNGDCNQRTSTGSCLQDNDRVYLGKSSDRRDVGVLTNSLYREDDMRVLMDYDRELERIKNEMNGSQTDNTIIKRSGISWTITESYLKDEEMKMIASKKQNEVRDIISKLPNIKEPTISDYYKLWKAKKDKLYTPSTKVHTKPDPTVENFSIYLPRKNKVNQGTPSKMTSSTQPDVQSNSSSTRRGASSNYLSLKSKATPGDRGSGEGSHWTSSGKPVADLREAEGQLNREGHHCEWNTTSGGEDKECILGGMASRTSTDGGYYRWMLMNNRIMVPKVFNRRVSVGTGRHRSSDRSLSCFGRRSNTPINNEHVSGIDRGFHSTIRGTKPGYRGEGSDGSSIMGMMEDGSKDVLDVTSSGEPVADLREAEGEVNREGLHGEWERKTSGGTTTWKECGVQTNENSLLGDGITMCDDNFQEVYIKGVWDSRNGVIRISKNITDDNNNDKQNLVNVDIVQITNGNYNHSYNNSNQELITRTNDIHLTQQINSPHVTQQYNNTNNIIGDDNQDLSQTEETTTTTNISTSPLHIKQHDINSPPEVTTTIGLADSSPPEVQSNSLPLAVEASSNYLSLKSKATPRDRGDNGGSSYVTSSGLSETINGSRGEVNERATTASGKEGGVSTGPQVEPAADLREAKGEVNREGSLQEEDKVITSGLEVGDISLMDDNSYMSGISMNDSNYEMSEEEYAEYENDEYYSDSNMAQLSMYNQPNYIYMQPPIDLYKPTKECNHYHYYTCCKHTKSHKHDHTKNKKKCKHHKCNKHKRNKTNTNTVPTEVTSTKGQSTSIHPAVSSPNYLPVNGNATPGDRGEGGVEGSDGGRVNDVTTSGGGLPVADLWEAKGEVNREADGRTTSGGTPTGNERCSREDKYWASSGDKKPHNYNHPHYVDNKPHYNNIPYNVPHNSSTVLNNISRKEREGNDWTSSGGRIPGSDLRELEGEVIKRAVCKTTSGGGSDWTSSGMVDINSITLKSEYMGRMCRYGRIRDEIRMTSNDRYDSIRSKYICGLFTNCISNKEEEGEEGEKRKKRKEERNIFRMNKIKNDNKLYIKKLNNGGNFTFRDVNNINLYQVH